MRHSLQLISACRCFHGKRRVHKRLCYLRVHPDKAYLGKAKAIPVIPLLSPPNAQPPAANDPCMSVTSASVNSNTSAHKAQPSAAEQRTGCCSMHAGRCRVFYWQPSLLSDCWGCNANLVKARYAA